MQSKTGPARSIREKREDILRLAVGHGAVSVRIFGSAAREGGTPPRDVDLLVELQPGRSLLDLVALKQDLEDLLGCKVDVVTEAALSPFIRDDVIKHAVNL